MNDFQEKPQQNQNFQQAYKEGWRAQVRGQVAGPVSLQVLLAWFGAGEISATAYVWHDRIGAWHPMRNLLQAMAGADARQPDSTATERLSRIRDEPVRNPLYLSATGILALLFAVIPLSFLGHQDTEVLALVLLLGDCYLWWWAWLELKGVTVSADSITFPARVRFWPGYLPYRMATIGLDSIDHARDGRSEKKTCGD